MSTNNTQQPQSPPPPPPATSSTTAPPAPSSEEEPPTKDKVVCTFTFTECAENHIGNEQIGEKLPVGPSLQDLRKTADRMVDWLTSRGITSGWKIELHVFNEQLDAGLLILKGLNAVNWPQPAEGNGGDHVKNSEKKNERSIMMDELDWDKKFYNSRRKVVQNKNARHNLCFCDKAQDPEYESGKGRTYAFADLPPFMRSLRSFYSDTLLVNGKALANPLIAEGNKYYDVSSTYIGWHGDVERSIVCGYRIGGPYPLHYWAFNGSTSLKKNDADLIWSFDMEDGWGYVMSHGASGQNWRKNQLHLRHAAGFPSVLVRKQERVPTDWSAVKAKGKETEKAPDTFTDPKNNKPSKVWEPVPDAQRAKRGREDEEFA